MRRSFAVLLLPILVSVTLAQEKPPATTQAVRPQRTEAEARARAETNRREREQQRRASGAPVELIADYVKANVGPVPESLGVDPFYRKYVDAEGIPVIASDKVPDAALLVARDIVNSMLAARPDLRKALIARRWRTGVIAEVEMTMDIPEYSRLKRPGAAREEPVTQEDRDYHANRSRGLGGNPTTGAEENLLGYPGTRYWGEHIFVHEFAHAIMGGGIRDVDPTMFAEIRAAYDKAMAAGKYVDAAGRKHYATTNPGEYWAEGVQWWFFSNYGECFAGNVKVETPEEFAAYDPTLNELIGRVFTTHRIPMDVFHGKRIRPVACGAAATPGAQPANAEEARWWEHVKFLADDALEGRQTGSDGYRKAAAYVVSQFEKAGLKPAGSKGFLQTVAFSRRRILEDQSRVALVRDGAEQVLAFGSDVTVTLRAELTPSVEAPLVFAGYGLSAPDAGHDDLAGLNLTGKVAVYISGTPAAITGPLAAHYQQAGVRWGALRAAGAIGAIAIPNPKTMEQPWERTAASRLNPVMTLTDPRFNDLAGMRVSLSVNPARAQPLFAGSGHTLPELLALVDAKKPLPRFALPASLRARVTLDSASLQSDNVAAVLPGSDPALAREHVVLTAHLDHLGVGAPVNGDSIYNGAMDNASGIATLLEVARTLAASQPRPKRSVVFVAVTAEEHGLLGSRFFAGAPTVPKSSIVANVNMDMFLPLVPMKSVMVLGLDESDLGDRVRDVAARMGLGVMADPQPERNRFTRSDQYSFIRQGVPALALKVGIEPGSPAAEIDAKWTKERYHAPSDDLQQPLDLGAAAAFTRLVGALSAEVANHAARPQWKANSFFRRFATAK